MKYLRLFESYRIKNLLNELDNIIDELGLSKDDYAIFGSGPLSIRNIIESNDLDIIIKKNKYPFKENPKKLGNIEFSYNWPDIKDINILIDNSEIIENHPFVKMEYVKMYKNKMNRFKDKIHLKKIKEYEDKKL